MGDWPPARRTYGSERILAYGSNGFCGLVVRIHFCAAFEQKIHLSNAVLKFNRFPDVLLQIVIYLIMHGDGMIDLGITARYIGADVDQILSLAIGGHDLLELIRVLPVILRVKFI